MLCKIKLSLYTTEIYIIVYYIYFFILRLRYHDDIKGFLKGEVFVGGEVFYLPNFEKHSANNKKFDVFFMFIPVLNKVFCNYVGKLLGF